MLKKYKKRIVILLSVFSVIILTLIGGATYLFNFAIGVEPPTPTNQAGKDVVSQTFAKARDSGKEWLESENAEVLTISTPDGIELQGYFVNSEIDNGKLAILIHGYRSEATMMGDYAKFYKENGYSVFMADNRGHGLSGGNYVGMGYLDSDDYIQWINYLLDNKVSKNTNIILHGISMGGATVSMMSSKHALPNQVKIGIDDCGYSSVNDEFGHQLDEMFGLPAFPLLNIASLESKLIAGYSFTDASPSESVKNSKIPMLFIHGGEDTYNPTWMGIEKYQNCSSKKDLYIVPIAEHGLSYYAQPLEYKNKVFEFIERYE